MMVMPASVLKGFDVGTVDDNWKAEEQGRLLPGQGCPAWK
jgi:hypothetical protein